MAYGKTAGCLILAGVAALTAEQFPVQHEHFRKSCAGVMTIDETGVAFAGPQHHEWKWLFQDIQQLKVSAEGVTVMSYDDTKLRIPGQQRFVFTGKIPAVGLYPLLRDHMDQRLVAALASPEEGAWSIPAKHLKPGPGTPGSQGSLAFGSESVVYATTSPGESRTWRISDIGTLSSSGPLELTVTTLEKTFHFQLKQPLAESRYDQFWMMVQKKNGKIQ